MAEVGSTGLMSAISSEWMRRISAARRAREPFRKTADLCTNFFQGAVGFMWEKNFRQEFFSGLPAPRFKITIAKAFELVAVVGPTLFWDYASRKVNTRKDIEIYPEAFGDPNDPNVMAMFDEFSNSIKAERNKDKTRASLLEVYLNYSQREQPDGGLMGAATLAITDALVKGRGTLWVSEYQPAGSQRTLTRAQYDSPMNLFIDPDCRKPDLSDATWIARKHVMPYYQVERMFNLPKNSLRNVTRNIDDEELTKSEKEEWAMHNVSGKTHDLIVWYEVFSKCGVGTRKRTGNQVIEERFDEVVGEYARICVTKHLDHPLNCHPKMLLDDEDVVREAFDWPVPYYADGRWPVAILDFYPSATGAWPIAPMAMGLGELIFMNIIMSVLCDRAYESSRITAAIQKRAGDDAIRAFKSDEFRVVMELAEANGANISELISFIQQPAMNGDILTIYEYVSNSFDKRVGLSDFMYGMQSKVTRVAADVSAKQEATSVRPEYMSRCVDRWQTEIANLERICAAWKVSGDDVKPLLGEVGAQLWDMMIANEDPEIVVREMRATIEASGSRRPNKARDAANLQNLAQYLLPTLTAHAQQTGDYEPYNGFIDALAKAQDQELSGMLIQSAPPQPPPPPAPAPQDVVPQQQPQQPPMPEQAPPPDGQMPPEMMSQGGPLPPGVTGDLRMNADVPPQLLQQLLGIGYPSA